MDSSGRKNQSGGTVVTFYYCSLFFFLIWLWPLDCWHWVWLSLCPEDFLPPGHWLLLSIWVMDSLPFAPPQRTSGSQYREASCLGDLSLEGLLACLPLLPQAPDWSLWMLAEDFSNLLLWASVLDGTKQYKISWEGKNSGSHRCFCLQIDK